MVEVAKGRVFGRRHGRDLAVRDDKIRDPPIAHCGHHAPVFSMEAQGSCEGFGSPFCKSSMEMSSGEHTKAMWPSRGGRLMVTPASLKRWQSA